MRLFLAVVPPPATQALAASVIDALRSPGDGVSWVKPDNLHYTVRFIGEVGEDGARRVGEAAREASAAVPRFEATLGSAGAFPDAKRARVLWLGLAAGDAPFAKLARALEAALARRGFAPESRGFNAHLTLGRVREPRDWTAALAGVGAPVADAARFAVDALQVIVSRLSSRGSIYTVRERAELRA
jgi:2'-5' RNA ligase